MTDSDKYGKSPQTKVGNEEDVLAGKVNGDHESGEFFYSKARTESTLAKELSVVRGYLRIREQ